MDLNMGAVLAAAQRQRAALKSPPLGAGQFLEILVKQGLVQTTKSLSAFRAVL